MYQLISVGDITMDLYFKGESLTQKDGHFSLAIGEKYYSEIFYSGVGGSAANVCIHASQLGLDSAPVATVGENSFKNIIVQSLIKKSVSTEFLHFERDHMSISTILLTPSGERTIIKYTDPKEHIYIPEQAVDRIKSAEIIFMGNLPDVTLAEREKFLRSVSTPQNLVAINFGTKDCQKGLKEIVRLLDVSNILFLNATELANLLGKKQEAIDLTKNYFSSVHSGLDVLVVTDGQRGSYAYTSKEVFHQPAVKVEKIVDATGAGDAFTAAFLAHYREHKKIQESLLAGSQYVAKELVKIGAN